MILIFHGLFHKLGAAMERFGPLASLQVGLLHNILLVGGQIIAHAILAHGLQEHVLILERDPHLLLRPTFSTPGFPLSGSHLLRRLLKLLLIGTLLSLITVLTLHHHSGPLREVRDALFSNLEALIQVVDKILEAVHLDPRALDLLSGQELLHLRILVHPLLVLPHDIPEGL